MSLDTWILSRRSLLGTAGLVGASLLMGLPSALAEPLRSAFKRSTWDDLVGELITLDGRTGRVERVISGHGSAFLVVIKGAAVAEDLVAVAHASFGDVLLFPTVDGTTATFTFNTLETSL